MSAKPSIIYTKTDEAPALATYSLLPIIQAFTKHSGIDVETRDISVAARILAAFSDLLPAEQRVADQKCSICLRGALSAQMRWAGALERETPPAMNAFINRMTYRQWFCQLSVETHLSKAHNQTAGATSVRPG